MSSSLSLSAFLDRNREAIICEWVRRLHTEVSGQYAARPLSELQETVTQAFHANVQFLIENDLRPIDSFIKRITRMRLESGFSHILRKSFGVIPRHDPARVLQYHRSRRSHRSEIT